MAPFFTPRGVATYADLVIRDSLRFAVRWEDLADEGREVDLSEEMMLITASIILKAMFSSETPESITQMKNAVETMITYVDTQMVPVRVPTWVPSRRNHRYFKACDLVHGSIAALIAERRAIHETDWPNDLLSRLMEARDPDTGEAMTETLLLDESITMFFAGHETTARTMAAAWYALGTHPEVAAGGWYTPQWVELLANRWVFGERTRFPASADRLLPEYHHVAVGDIVCDGPNYACYFRVQHVDPPHALAYRSIRHPRRGSPIDITDPKSPSKIEQQLRDSGTYLDFTWALVLSELPRLLVRTRANYSPPAFRLLSLPLGLVDATYGLAMLRAIAIRAGTVDLQS